MTFMCLLMQVQEQKAPEGQDGLQSASSSSHETIDLLPFGDYELFESVNSHSRQSSLQESASDEPELQEGEEPPLLENETSHISLQSECSSLEESFEHYDEDEESAVFSKEAINLVIAEDLCRCKCNRNWSFNFVELSRRALHPGTRSDFLKLLRSKMEILFLRVLLITPSKSME